MDKYSQNYYSFISGFWLFIILIVDGNNGTDLLDAIINYISKLG